MNNIVPDISSYTEIKLHNRTCAEHDSILFSTNNKHSQETMSPTHSTESNYCVYKFNHLPNSDSNTVAALDLETGNGIPC